MFTYILRSLYYFLSNSQTVKVSANCTPTRAKMYYSFRNRIEETSEVDDKRYLMAFPHRCLRTIRHVFATCLHIVRENDRSSRRFFFPTFEISYSKSVDYTTNMRDILRYTRTLIKRNFARMSLISRVFATYRLCTRIRPVQSDNRTPLTSSSFVYLARRFLFAVRQQ